MGRHSEKRWRLFSCAFLFWGFCVGEISSIPGGDEKFDFIIGKYREIYFTELLNLAIYISKRIEVTVSHSSWRRYRWVCFG